MRNGGKSRGADHHAMSPDSQSLLSDAGLLSDTGLTVCPFRHWSHSLSFQTLVSQSLLSDTGLTVCPFRHWSRGFSIQTLVSQPSVLSDTDMISQSVLSDTGFVGFPFRHWSRGFSIQTLVSQSPQPQQCLLFLPVETSKVCQTTLYYRFDHLP